MNVSHRNGTEEVGSIAPHPADTWQVYTLADAYKPRPPLKYVVGGLLEMPGLSIFYGAPGTLKSMLLADMAICVTAGLTWLEPLPETDAVVGFSTIQSPVMWLDFDNGLRRTMERFDALGRTRGLPPGAPLHFYSMPSPWLDAGSIDHILQLEGRIKRLGVGLVVVDNLCLVSGDADEGSPEMAPVMSNFRQLTERCGVHIAIAHHQRKTNGVTARKGETLRGHGSIEAAIDLAVLVEREEGSSTIQMTATKVRGAEVSPFGAMFTYEHHEGTKELAAARFFGVAVDDPESTQAIKATIRNIVGKKPNLNKKQLTNAVKEVHPQAGINQIRDLIDRMVTDEELVCTDGEKGAKHYTLPQRQASITGYERGGVSP